MKRPMDTIISDRARLREQVVALRKELAEVRRERDVWQGKYGDELDRSKRFFAMFGHAQEEEHRLRRMVIDLGGKP